MSYETQTIGPPVEREELEHLEMPIDLMDRTNDGLTVTLWLVRSTAALYVTVEDRKGLEADEQPELQRLDVPYGHNPLDTKHGVYWHPLAHL